ncbi:hypothetical protein Tco_1347158 [Tanacetum coccineum]
MESVKKSIDERAKHKEEYNSWVNERKMQTTEDKVDSSKALDASLVDTESSGTTLKEQDTSSISGNNAHVDDTTRARNIDHTTSLIAKNDDFKAQLQEKGFAIAALNNELRKLTGNSMNTKFAKLSILWKPALQPRRNQSVVRQPTAFKKKNLQLQRPQHKIAPGSSRYSSNDMCHESLPKKESKKQTQKAVGIQNLG